MTKEEVWEALQYDIRINQYGSKVWFLNGLLHRVNGPAVEQTDGCKVWYQNGKLHREDGPAVESASGTKFWYLNGTEYSEQQFNELQGVK